MPVVPLPDPLPMDELKRASKQNFGLMPDVEQPVPDPIPEVRFSPPPEPETLPEEAPVAAIPDDQTTEPLTAVEAPAAPTAQPKTRVRAARKPVVRKTIKKKSLIPDETIEIE
jgi:hypothetical protein